MCSLLQKLAHDLRTTIFPAYPQILTRLLGLLPRSLKAETLSILLPTFTSLFKYVLIPSDATANTIEVVWKAFSDVLPNCDPEIQRAVAEVWGNVLRRVKGEARESCVTVIMASASTDVAAWVAVCACKVRLLSLPTKYSSYSYLPFLYVERVTNPTHNNALCHPPPPRIPPLYSPKL